MELQSEKTGEAGGVRFIMNDGGRHAAGFKGRAGDCGVRAAAIATGTDYRDAYAALYQRQRAFRARSRRRIVRVHSPSPRNGVWREVMHEHMIAFGAAWIPLADIGGPVVRVRDVAELWPSGRIIMRLARHYSAMIDGVNHDTWEQHQEKRVYGIWLLPGAGDCAAAAV